ncbi:hypothetical protein GIB67_013891 [Kingdonia uniflora]|uniref:Uncharacterized protein n=1 Tax=Kingdonia uniflora TaxID=39325 RepID=A0A7J7LDD6_9MAGN|nr:hypothetical protein GIB67_013891 [Kingdonia uniflora]
MINYYKASSMWSAIKELMNIVKDQIQWMVGNGSKINIWDKLWIGDQTLRNQILGQNNYLTANQLIHEGQWQLPEEIEAIFQHFNLNISIVPIDNQNQDCSYWLPDQKTKFSANSAYRSDIASLWCGGITGFGDLQSCQKFQTSVGE